MQTGTMYRCFLAATMTLAVMSGTVAAEDWFPASDLDQPLVARTEGWPEVRPTGDAVATEGFDKFWEDFCTLLFWAHRESQFTGKPHAENQYIGKLAGFLEYPLAVPPRMLDIEIETLETADARFTRLVIGEILVKRYDAIMNAKPGVGESDSHRQVNAPYIQPSCESFERMNLCLDFVQDGTGAPWKLRRIRSLPMR